MVVAAANKAGSTDPIALAKALEGLSFDTMHGPVTMRASDHQIQAPVIISHISADAPVPIVYDGNDFGVAYETDQVVPKDDIELPTTCKMERPA
jgi:branched-chain amino acid transport system substrate-binding protein